MTAVAGAVIFYKSINGTRAETLMAQSSAAT
jgi:hypothetical protein